MAITASSAPNMDSPNVTRFPRATNWNTPSSNIKPIKQANDDDDYNNYIHALARKERIARIGEAYFDVLGRPMPKFVQHEVQRMMDAGVTSGMIVAVLEYTACAPRPSWAYARAVIYRNEERGIKDEYDFHNSLCDHERDGMVDLR